MSQLESERILAGRTEPRRSRREMLLLAVILAVALFVRLYGLTWDHGYLFHPDERMVVFVTADLSLAWPPDWAELLSPASTWNPGFFSYGSLPIYLLRILSSAAARFWPAMESVRSFYVIGRVISALADVGTIYLTYALARRLYGVRTALLGGAFLAFAVLHVQLSHYYAVDTLLACAVMLVLLLSTRLAQSPSFARCLGVGAAIGVAAATKISALALAAPVGLACIGAHFINSRPDDLNDPAPGGGWIGEALRGLIVAGWAAALVFVLLEPYALIDLPTFIEDIQTESMMVRGTLDLPYTRQYAGTIPYLYQITQTIRWSLGPLLGIAGFVGVVYAVVRLIKHLRKGRWQAALAEGIPVLWFLVYFGIIGSFHAKFLRYMLPVTPLLCLCAAALLVKLGTHLRTCWRYTGRILAGVTLAGSVLYVLAFLNIYASTHPWEQATEWMCSEIPEKSVLMIEHWDQPLPIVQGVGEHNCWNDFTVIEFPAYNPDSEAKLTELVESLQSADYVVIASNRLYGSITPLSQRYPMTAQYYHRLFAEELGFELVYFAQVYPQLGPFRLVNDTLSRPGLPVPELLSTEGRLATDLVLGHADESYSVYDHPMPLVFERTSDLSEEVLRALLTAEPPG